MSQNAVTDEEKAETKNQLPPNVEININQPASRASRQKPVIKEAARATPYVPEPDDADDDEEEEEETDPLTEFLDAWRGVHGYRMNVSRLADPMYAREPGYWLKTCEEFTPCGQIPFNPDTFVQDLQKLGRSGGKYRVQLVDHKGSYVSGGNYTGVFNDPPFMLSGLGVPAAAPADAATPERPDPMRAAFEVAQTKFMERMFDQMLEPKTAETKAGDSLTDEQRLTLLLAGNANLIGTVSSNLASVMTAGKGDAKRGWVEKGIDALAQNTTLGVRALGMVERVISRVLPPAPDEDENDGEDEEETMTLLNYLKEKCITNEAISFRDEPIARFAEEDPTAYAEFLDLLREQSTELVMGVVALKGGRDIAVALKAPHARAWVAKVQELAKAEGR